MAMPAKTRTWNGAGMVQRITFTTFTEASQIAIHALKEALKGMTGVTVKGSGDNVAAAMDGTDRIGAHAEWLRGSSTTAVHSWIVLTCANIGGIDVLIEWVGGTDNQVRIVVSPSGGFVVNVTNARFSPTATDEVIIIGSTTAGGSFLSDQTSGDRVWSAIRDAGGAGFIFLKARAGTWCTHFIIGSVQSAVQAPATFAPAWAAVGGTSAPGITSWTSSTPWKTRVNNVIIGATLGCSVSMEGTGGVTVPQRYSSVLDLQAGGWPVVALGLHSQVAGATGKVCNLIDVWAGNTAAADGDTYPNDTSRQFIAFGDFVLPWDGTAVVDGTPVVMT